MDWKPFPYQEEGATWLLTHPRSILADEMGLGKTIQVGMALTKLHTQICGDRCRIGDHRDLDVLIVGRGSLAYQWQDELETKFGIPVQITTEDKDLDLLSLGGCHYINYDKFRLERWQAAIATRKWTVLIVDEAHRMKGRKARRSIHLERVARNVPFVWFVSGSITPNGDPAEVWQFLHVIDRKAFSSYWDFVKQHCNLEMTPWGPKPIGAKRPNMFGKMMTAWMLRRVRASADVGRWLPSLRYVPIRHPLTSRQRRMYLQMKRDFMISFQNGQSNLEAQNTAAKWAYLRQVCLTPKLFGDKDDGGKLKALDDLCDQILDSGRKCLIFTWHRAFADLIADRINDRYERSHSEFTAVALHGGMDDGDKKRAIFQFTKTAPTRFLVGTIATMAEGLNLQVASVVIFTELSYVPMENTQAVARVHREGQTQDVIVYQLIAENTIEERITKIVSEKRGSNDEIDMAYLIAREELRVTTPLKAVPSPEDLALDRTGMMSYDETLDG